MTNRSATTYIGKFSYWLSGVTLLMALSAPDAHSIVAKESHPYLSFGLNRSHLSLDQDELPDFFISDGHEDGAGTALALGYQFGKSYFELLISSNNLTSTVSSLFGIETLSYSKYQAAGGYDFPIGSSSFSIGPEFSLVKMSINIKEGVWFNSDEEQEVEFDENGWGAALQTKWHIGRVVKLKFTYGWYELGTFEQTEGILSMEIHL